MTVPEEAPGRHRHRFTPVPCASRGGRFAEPHVSLGFKYLPPEARAAGAIHPWTLSARLICPPPTGAATPVVPGAEGGRPRATRTAR